MENPQRCDMLCFSYTSAQSPQWATSLGLLKCLARAASQSARGSCHRVKATKWGLPQIQLPPNGIQMDDLGVPLGQETSR